jgi:hypothetical protein
MVLIILSWALSLPSGELGRSLLAADEPALHESPHTIDLGFGIPQYDLMENRVDELLVVDSGREEQMVSTAASRTATRVCHIRSAPPYPWPRRRAIGAPARWV